MRTLAIAAALTLSACAFSSEAPFFTVEDAAHPFEDGARYHWTESEGERYDITFRRDGAAYDVAETTHADEPMEDVIFVAITDTPEEDYIAQVRLERDDNAVAYSFLWRVGDGFRIVSDPGRLVGDDEKLTGAQGLCRWRAYEECSLLRREDIIALYRAAIYPRFVAGGATPESYMELTPFGAPLPATPAK